MPAEPAGPGTADKGRIKGKENHMATGSIRKKGKRWYYRFYVEDTSGVRRQKEFAGTESKSETEQLLKEALSRRPSGLRKTMS